MDPVKAVINVELYPMAVSQVAKTSQRAVIRHADLDTLLSGRDRINAELKSVIDGPTEEVWGVHIERVEVKDVALPETMMRSMSRQAEADRGRRARVVADGEFQASAKLAQAALAMDATPGACNCGCCRPWSTSRQRRTAPWSCRSRSNCCASSTRPALRPIRAPLP